LEPARHAVWHVRLRGLRRAVASCTNHVWGCGPSSLQHLTQLSCKALRTGIVLTVISVPASTYSSSKMDAELCSSETSCTDITTKLSAALDLTAPCTVRHHGMSQQGDVPIKHHTPSGALTSPMLYGINTV
jgi:hypothetical protein